MKKAFYERSFWLHEFLAHLAVISVFAAKQSACHYMQTLLKNQGFTHKDHWHTDHRQ